MSECDRARDARTDLDLREVVGGDRPPDLLDAILSRAEAVAAARAWMPGPRRGWLVVAALIVLGVSALIAAALGGWAEEPARVTQDPIEENEGIVRVSDPTMLVSVPTTARRLELAWLTDAEASMLERFPELRSLSIERGSGQGRTLTDAGLLVLARASKLRELRLAGCAGVAGEVFGGLVHLPLLESLDLVGAELTLMGARCLGALPNLRSVKLERCSWRAEDLEALGAENEWRLERLVFALNRTVGLHTRDRLSDSVLEFFRQLDLSELKSLVLDQVDFDEQMFGIVAPLELDSFTAVGWKFALGFARRHLERHPDCRVRFIDAPRQARLARPAPVHDPSPGIHQSRARYFVPGGQNLAVIPDDATEIDVYWLCDEDVHLLRRFGSLRSLVVRCGQAERSDDRATTPLSDRLFDELVGATGLEELGLWYCEGIDGAGLSKLSKLPRLSKLLISSKTGLSSEGWSAVASLPHLVSLEATGPPSSVDLAALTQGPCLNLRYLRIWDLDIWCVDEGQDAVREFLLRPGFSRLDRLDVLLSIPDGIVDTLAQRSSLKVLSVEHPSPDGRRAARAFAKLRPDCEVILPPEHR